MRYISIDPSGSFNEGKGHTGLAIMDDNNWNSLEVYSIDAKKYNTRLDYWNAIIDFTKQDNITVIIESFNIRNNGFLLGKMPETLLLIGAIVRDLETRNINYVFQSPSAVKSRFKDDLLGNYIPNFEKRNKYYYLNNKCINDHIRDALKHLLYFKKYNLKEEVSIHVDSKPKCNYSNRQY